MADSALNTLILVRHAKSDWDPIDGVYLADVDRPLSERGKRDIDKIAAWLATVIEEPVRILTSPARRAQDTAQVLVSKLKQAKIDTKKSLYMANPGTLEKVVRQADSKCLMLVAHNPGLEEFVLRLAPELAVANRYRKLMPTSAVYAFSYAGRSLDPGKVQVLFHQRPKLL